HLRGQVTNLRGESLSGAEVRVETNLGASFARNLETNLKGEFETEFDGVNRKSIQIRLAATRNGYRDAHENTEFESPDETRLIRLVMRKDEADARQLSLEEMTSQVGRRLRSPGGIDALSPSAAACEQGARELVDAGRAENAVRMLNSEVTH